MGYEYKRLYGNFCGPYKEAVESAKHNKMAASRLCALNKCHTNLLRRVPILASNYSFTIKVDNKQCTVIIIVLSYAGSSYLVVDIFSLYLHFTVYRSNMWHCFFSKKK